MSLKQLKQLKVKEIAEPDCILFLWTTGPQLINATELMKAWGIFSIQNDVYDLGQNHQWTSEGKSTWILYETIV
jgi:N6-adenosine-specific RNA methylase IME4